MLQLQPPDSETEWRLLGGGGEADRLDNDDATTVGPLLPAPLHTIHAQLDSDIDDRNWCCMSVLASFPSFS